jgi:hypothetical protein
MGGYRREQLKVGRILDDRDLAVLAALFNDVVAPDLTVDKGNSGEPPSFTVLLATQDEHEIVPTEGFLEGLKADGFQIVAPADSLYRFMDCELRLWAWIGQDSASVGAYVWSSSQSRSALVFRENDRWRACGSNIIGHWNQIRVLQTKK